MLILLDIDGVMVPANSWKKPDFLHDGFAAFSIKSIDALRRIISETDAKIVLTTSHKSRYGLPQWLNIFKSRGIEISKIDRLTDNYSNLNRKQEILDWLVNNSEEHYVILDDDKSLNALPANIKEHLVLTSPLVGLTSELAEHAISILNNSALSA